MLTLVVCLPDVASSQSESVSNEQKRVIFERIEEARAQGGPYSKDLINPLTILVEIYQQTTPVVVRYYLND